MPKPRKKAPPTPLTRPKRSPKERKANRMRERAANTLLTTHHPTDAHPTDGLDERRIVLMWRAMELRMMGRSLREIGLQLQSDFELAETIHHSVIDEWLDEAFAQTATAKQTNADKHCAIIFLRTERMISELMPLAMGKVHIARTRVMDGERVIVMDEEAVKERMDAIAEIRKQHDQQARLLKIVGPANGTGEDGAQLSAHNMTIFIEKTVTNNILVPGQAMRAGTTGALSLASGDADIDSLDAEALDGHATVEPI